MPGPHSEPPLGKVLWNASNAISRAFEDALNAAGGSRPTWFVLMALKSQPVANQSELARMVGIRGATLTHHLAAMEADGLITRHRDPANRRVHVVELTSKGEDVFHRLTQAAGDFDRALRAGIPDTEIAQLRDTLAKLEANVSDDPSPPTP